MLFEKPGKTPRFRYTTAFTSETTFYLAKENVNDETGSEEGSRDVRRRPQIPGKRSRTICLNDINIQSAGPRASFKYFPEFFALPSLCFINPKHLIF